MHTYKYVYIQICTHTYMHACIHTYIPKFYYKSNGNLRVVIKLISSSFISRSTRQKPKCSVTLPLDSGPSA